LANHGIEVQGYVHDTMLQSYVLEVHKPHGLEQPGRQRHLGRKGLTYEDLCGKGVHQISFAQVDVARASHYACEDADFTLWPCTSACGPLLQADDKLRFDLPVGNRQQRSPLPHRAQRCVDRCAHLGRAKPQLGPAHHAT
jgi:DNA polymerase I-like protein with 3'-5' exonuclease and polymerase domains